MSDLYARCWQCEKSIDDALLRKCPICFKHFCEEHGHLMSGRPFCSPGCAEYFFFSDDDASEDA